MCETPSRRPGCPLALWGHGVRERHLEGPPAPGEDPADLVIIARRYLCQPCGAVLVVVPHGVVPWRRYTAPAIALALALWGWAKKTVAEVRRQTSTTPAPTGFGDPGRWASLRRWVAAAVRGILFARAKLPRPAAARSARQIAKQVAIVLAAHALPSLRHLSLPAQAFHGGGRMA
jgi:hypothetical protein